MIKILAVIAATVMLSGCGAIDRFVAKVTGDGSETCHDGVIYLQFTSGVSVKYNQDGSISTCKKG
jgi:hypothetical protein